MFSFVSDDKVSVYLKSIFNQHEISRKQTTRSFYPDKVLEWPKLHKRYVLLFPGKKNLRFTLAYTSVLVTGFPLNPFRRLFTIGLTFQISVLLISLLLVRRIV